MTITEIAPGALAIESFLTSEEAEILLREADEYENWIDATVGLYEEGKLKSEVRDPNLSSAQVTRKFQSKIPAIEKRISQIHSIIEEQWKIQSNIDTVYSVSRYHPGAFLARHRDTGFDQTNRVFTIVIYLNDNYEGGRFVFSDLGISLRPASGDALIFASELFHEVEPISKGIRYCLVTFASKP